MAIRLYNTLTNRKDELVPIEPGKIGMYHCGPTVYSSPHIGNFRSFLVADLMRRFFEDRGYEVYQVMNITDVGHMTADDEDSGEDKMVRAARKEQRDPYKVARKYEDEFTRCLEQLCFRVPHLLPRATEHVEEMGAMIGELLAKGFAYQVNGNVYFEISKFSGYGKLSNKVLDDLVEGARVAVNDEKRDPRDFALWKVDPDHLMQWEAPFPGGSKGFPGWHIECSAMSMKYLGSSFDIHTGGEDNLFPHHECEVAQSEAATGERFVNIWLHVKHLLVDGQKMSKSEGNFLTVQAVLDRGYSGGELRYALSRVQYRKSLNFTWAGLEEARAAIQRVRQSWEKVARIVRGKSPAGSDSLADVVDRSEEGFTAALEDDLNTSEALAEVFALVGEVNRSDPDQESARLADRAFRRFQDVLVVFGEPPESVGARVPADLMAKALAREEARKAKDFAEADRLRDEIQAAGFQIVDTAAGPRLEKL